MKRSRTPAGGFRAKRAAGRAAEAAPQAGAANFRLAPAGMRLRPDPAVRLVAGGSVLVGGSPVRVLRLTPGGARQVTSWFEGAPVSGGTGARTLARKLLDAGIAHPDVTALGGLQEASRPSARRMRLTPASSGQVPIPAKAHPRGSGRTPAPVCG